MLMTAKLVHVGLMRAMDHLDVFALETPSCTIIQHLLAAMAVEEGGGLRSSSCL